MQIDPNGNMLTVRVRSSFPSISIKTCWICPSISGLMARIRSDVEDVNTFVLKSGGESGSYVIGVGGARNLTI
jgi:hypothetical protein